MDFAASQWVSRVIRVTMAAINARVMPRIIKELSGAGCWVLTRLRISVYMLIALRRFVISNH
jgi:hypothetical protein